MASFEALSNLIQALSKSEKRYFSMFCDLQKGEKVYLKLYDLLEKKGPEPEAAAASLLHQYPKETIETARKHLYRMLLKSLRAFEDEKTVEKKLMNRINDIKLLFNKGLVELCLTELGKAKALAQENEKFAYFVILARLELEYLTKLEFPDCSEEDLMARQEKLNGALHQEMWISRHSALYEILQFRYFHTGATRSQQETDHLNDLLLEEFQITSNKHYNSLSSSVIHLHFQSTYFMMTGNHPESLRLFYQVHQLFKRNPRLLVDAPMYYLYLINGILSDLRSMRQYSQMPFFIESLQEVLPSSGNLEQFVYLLTYQHQLARLIDLGQFSQGLELVRAYKQREEKSPRMVPPNAQATLHLLAGLVYFGLQDYHAALQHVNQVLNASSKFISHQVYILCRLLSLVLHGELGNEDFLIYEIRSIERKLKAEKKLFRVEKITLDFFKKGGRLHHSKKQLVNLHLALQQAAEDPHEKQLLAWFDLVSWVEAKLRNIPMAQRVKEKAQPQLQSVASL